MCQLLTNLRLIGLVNKIRVRPSREAEGRRLVDAVRTGGPRLLETLPVLGLGFLVVS